LALLAKSAPFFALLIVSSFDLGMESEAFKSWLNTFESWGADFQWIRGKTFLSEFHIVILTAVLYLVTTFGLQRFMRDRKPFTLTHYAIVHNFILFSGSLFVLCASSYYLIPQFFKRGAASVVCDAEGTLFVKGQVNYWFYIFYVSKVFEFVDTVILILRKKKLIFLHVYHHAITLLLVWSTMQENNPVQFADITANCFVHVIMYYYYFRCELGLSTWWKKYITSAQILQFCWDLGWHNFWLYAHYVRLGKWGLGRAQDTGCHGSVLVKWWSDFVILSFLLLFVQFYKKSYTKQSDEENSKKAKSA